MSTFGTLTVGLRIAVALVDVSISFLMCYDGMGVY